jgi:membrane protease YdiL (CAAX protease family)
VAELTGRMPHRKPSRVTLVVAFIPFVAMCFTVPLWDRIDPRVFGLPFNLFWLIAWVLLSSLCLAIAYRRERARDASGEPRP